MNKINASKLQEMFLYGGEVLSQKKEEINALNVFPFPDGDTGSNMNMTMSSGINAIKNKKYKTVGELTHDFSKGLLMGARGNSGVILSQYFRGLAEGLKDVEEVTVEQFHAALGVSVTRSYKSVIKAV